MGEKDDYQAEKNLTISRNKFLELAKLPDENFWVYALQKLDIDQIDESLLGPKKWTPHRSNCPGLDCEMEFLIASAPIAWQKLLKEIFVGRSYSGHVNALAHTEFRARVVEFGLQYTLTLYNYATAFHQLNMSSVSVRRLLAKGQHPTLEYFQDLEDRFQNMWTSIEKDRVDALKEGQLKIMTRHFNGEFIEEKPGLIFGSVSAAEYWVVCHEIAHHLLGHTVSRKRKDTQQFLYSLGIEVPKADLNEAQTQELDADRLACLMVAGFTKPDQEIESDNVKKSITGSFIALLNLGHMYESWTDDRSAGSLTHPNTMLRLANVRNTANWLINKLPPEPKTISINSSKNLLIDLWVFTEFVVNAYISEISKNTIRRPYIIELLITEFERKSQ